MNASYALTRFLTATEPLGPAARLQAFRAMLRANGVLVDEPPGDTTDGYAIALFGLQVIAISEIEAHDLWLHRARTLIGGWPNVSLDPALRMAQLTWAIHILQHERQSSRDHLTQACQIIVTLSANPTLLTRARTYARAQGLTIEPAGQELPHPQSSAITP